MITLALNVTSNIQQVACARIVSSIINKTTDGNDLYDAFCNGETRSNGPIHPSPVSPPPRAFRESLHYHRSRSAAKRVNQR